MHGDDSGGGAAIVVLLIVFLYFLPLVVAGARHHPSAGGIAVLNIFLGWTFLGWVVALAWAFSGTGRPATVIQVNTGTPSHSHEPRSVGRSSGAMRSVTPEALDQEERVPCP